MTDDFFTCVNKTCHKLSCICVHSTIKVTHGKVHFIHRVYMPWKQNSKLKRVDNSKSQIKVNVSSKSLLCMKECEIN